MTRFLAVGVGCRKGVSGETIAAVVRRALDQRNDEANDEARPLHHPSGGPPPPPLRGMGGCARRPPGVLPRPAGEGDHAKHGGGGPPLRLFTHADKAAEPGLIEAAAILGAPLTGLPFATLREQAILTPSPAAHARFGVDSIAEAAALGGAGPGSRLVGPRLAADGVTCALALPAGFA